MFAPQEFSAVLAPFSCLFTQPVWFRVQCLIFGAILSSGARTICSILRTLGLGQYESFQNYHRVFNRASWSAHQAGKILLGQLVENFVPHGPLVLGIDELLERRRGSQIGALGIYRDSARSSKSFMVKSSGLRWISLQLLVWIPWAKRFWGLPFLTALAPSERYHKARGQKHKTIIDWARQLAAQVRRWHPNGPIVLIGDSNYSAVELLHACKQVQVTLVTRLRLDAALFEPPPKPTHKRGRPRIKGSRLPSLEHLLESSQTKWTILKLSWYGQKKRLIEYCTGTALWYRSGKAPVPIRWVLVRDPKGRFDPQAFLSTDLEHQPKEILLLFMRRWPMEVTFQETRAHLGMDGQRLWNKQALARATPCLLGLFSLVTLMAHKLQAQAKEDLIVEGAAWYEKELPTFSDALNWVRKKLWKQENFWTSIFQMHGAKNPHTLFNHMTELICRAA